MADFKYNAETIRELQSQEYQISIKGKQIELSRKHIPLENLTLDPNNQRIQFTMRAKGLDPTDEQIHEVMYKSDHVRELLKSIDYNGGLLTPLITKVNGVVVEGNNRLVALRELKKKNDKDGKKTPEAVLNPPCEVLPEGFDESNLLWLLGEWHIAGKHEWNPYEQAEFIYKMWTDEGQTYDFLSSHLRMSKTTIKNKISAYEMMKEYLMTNSEPGEIYKWSYFEELFKKKELRDLIESEKGFKEDYFDLVSVGGKKTGSGSGNFEGMNVRKLPEVVNNKRAWETLKDTKDFKKAYSIVEEIKIKSGFLHSILNCIQSFDSVEMKEIIELQNASEDPDHETLLAIKDLHKKINNTAKLIGIDLE